MQKKCKGMWECKQSANKMQTNANKCKQMQTNDKFALCLHFYYFFIACYCILLHLFASYCIFCIFCIFFASSCIVLHRIAHVCIECKQMKKMQQNEQKFAVSENVHLSLVSESCLSFPWTILPGMKKFVG